MFLRFVILSILILSVKSESPPITTPDPYFSSEYMGPCTWFEKINTNTRGGEGKSYDTIMECREACMKENNCKFGFDWDPENVRYKCWFSTNNIAAYAEGVSHFLFTCPGTTLFPTTSSGSGGGGGGELKCTWQKWTNELTAQGTLVSENTLEDCQKQCLKMDRCKYGLDFSPNDAPGSRCYIATSRKRFYGKDVNHYMPDCDEGGRTTKRTNSARFSSEVSIIVTTVLMLLTAFFLTLH